MRLVVSRIYVYTDLGLIIRVGDYSLNINCFCAEAKAGSIVKNKTINAIYFSFLCTLIYGY